MAVFIVDDNRGYREVAAAVIDATPGFELAGSATSSVEAVDAILACRHQPDLVLMDINLGPASGLEVTRTVTTLRPTIRVVLVSTLHPEELPIEARSSGATGYLPKAILSPAVLQAAHTGAYDWPA